MIHLSIIMRKRHAYAWVRKGYSGKLIQNMACLYRVRSKEIPSGRYIKKEVFDLEGGSGRADSYFLLGKFTSLNVYFCSQFRIMLPAA